MSIQYSPDPSVKVPPWNPFAGINVCSGFDCIYLIMLILTPIVIAPLFLGGLLLGICWLELLSDLTPDATKRYRENRCLLKAQRYGRVYGEETLEERYAKNPDAFVNYEDLPAYRRHYS
jgi:hypothetical protein